MPSIDMARFERRPFESPAAKLEMAGSDGGKNMNTDCHEPRTGMSEETYDHCRSKETDDTKHDEKVYSISLGDSQRNDGHTGEELVMPDVLVRSEPVSGDDLGISKGTACVMCRMTN